VSKAEKVLPANRRFTNNAYSTRISAHTDRNGVGPSTLAQASITQVATIVDHGDEPFGIRRRWPHSLETA
jgi:hypothetical protein